MNVSNPVSIPCAVLLLIIIAIITIIIFKYIKYNNKKLENQIESERELLKNYTEDTISKLLKDISQVITDNSKPLDKAELTKLHHEELLNTFQKLRRIIKDDLTNTMNETNACRVALYLLHNGQRSASGIEFIKVSCVGERILIGSGVKEQIINHSNIPINIFDNMLEKLIENGRYVIMNDQETMNSARAHFISSPKIRYSQEVSLYDASNNILGFVLAEYDHPYNKITSDTEYEVLKALGVKISPILSFSDYSNLTIED